jgi:hypothetical protein
MPERHPSPPGDSVAGTKRSHTAGAKPALLEAAARLPAGLGCAGRATIRAGRGCARDRYGMTGDPAGTQVRTRDPGPRQPMRPALRAAARPPSCSAPASPEPVPASRRP